MAALAAALLAFRPFSLRAPVLAAALPSTALARPGRGANHDGRWPRWPLRSSLPRPDRYPLFRMTIARARTVTGVDRALRWVSRPRLRPLPALPPGSTSVLLYSPSNLNQVDGSAIWVRSVVDTLLVDPAVHVTLPLRAPIRRDVITGPLRSLPQVDLV